MAYPRRMARRTKDAPERTTAAARTTSGRANPKGTAPRGAGGTRARTTRGDAAPGSATSSGRYTAPIPDELRSSPWWVPAIMLGLFGIGVIGIVLYPTNLAAVNFAMEPRTHKTINSPGCCRPLNGLFALIGIAFYPTNRPPQTSQRNRAWQEEKVVNSFKC